MKVLFVGMTLAAASALAAQPGGQECATQAKKSGCCAQEAAAVAQDCNAREECCDKTMAAAQALPQCPLAGSECLTKAFDAASTKLASLSDEDRATLASSMQGTQLCPIGKRMGPSFAYLGEAVAAIDEFDHEMAKCDMEAPAEMTQLLQSRSDIVAAVHNVLAKQEAIMGSMAHCAGAQACSAEASSCNAVAASAGQCPATAAAKQECSAKASECTATAAAKQECSAGSSECSAKAAIAEGGYCWDTFKSSAIAMVSQGDELLSCWSKAPAELASLSDETRAQIGTSIEKAMSVNPAMTPMMQAVGYYADALQKACDVDAKILAKMGEAGCTCEYFKASSDLLHKATEIANTLNSHAPKADKVASAF